MEVFIMGEATSVEITEYSFSKNIDFSNTPLNEVKTEYMRKKIQLNLANNIREHSTADLSQYVLELAEHIEELESKKERHKIDSLNSMKLSNLLIITSVFMFIIFGGFTILTKSVPLLIITLINGFVMGIVYLYKQSKKKNINNI